MKGRKAQVTFEVEAPADCTWEEFIEWIQFGLHIRASMPVEPLGSFDLEATKITHINLVPITKSKIISNE